jgi:hypothetical protein
VPGANGDGTLAAPADYANGAGGPDNIVTGDFERDASEDIASGRRRNLF